MCKKARLNSLKKKHAVVAAEIAEMQKHPSIPSAILATKKKEKLNLKDEITRLEAPEVKSSVQPEPTAVVEEVVLEPSAPVSLDLMSAA